VDAQQRNPTPHLVDGWASEPHRGIYLALLLVSMALLTLEVAFTRFFSFTIWYHLAYLTISMALLGFGSSGAIVASFPQLFARNGHARLTALLIAGAALTVASLVFLARHPIDVADIVAAPLRFSFELLLYYAAVGLPFFLAGFAISVPFATYPHLMGRLYFADLLGAALGCLLAVSAIELLGVPGLILTAAGLLLAGAAALGIGNVASQRSGWVAIAAILLIALAGPLGARVPIEVTPSKRPPGLDGGDAQDSYRKWTALNRVDASGWEKPTRAQYWGMAGLMPGYRGPRPKVAMVTYDGCNGSNIYSYSGSFDDYAMLEHHLLRTPYIVLERPEVLVIGVGGGIDMMNAIVQGARHVTGAELQPKTIYLLKDRLRHFTGGFYDRPDVELVAGEGRHFVRKSNQTFDLIQITAVDTFAAQATGAYVLAESYLYTTDAMQDYLAHLSDDGLASLVVGDIVQPGSLPPLGTRLALTGYRALEALGAERPQDHLMVVGSMNPKGTAITEAILVKKQPLTRGEITKLERFVRNKGMQVLYSPDSSHPGGTPLSTVLGGDEAARQAALDDEWFRMDAVSDRDPFFYNVGRWSNFARGASVFFMFPGSFVGQLVLVLMLVQSLLLGGLLICLPLFRGARGGLQSNRLVSYLGYFLALGIGFMFIEISFVQSFVLFLGSPTHALSVTIFSLLLFSSLGSLLSTRFASRPESALRYLMPTLVCLVILYALGLGRLFETFLHLELVPRILIAVTAQLPLGLALGAFMPLGIACVSRENPRLVPWAWGINGIGSVLGTTLAVILAMAWGFTTVAMLAAALYAVGTLGMIGVRPATRAGFP